MLRTQVDLSEVYSNVSVVIPTNRKENYTVETVPDEAEVLVQTEEGLNVARNRGVENASNDWIVIADDDIYFPTKVVGYLLDGMHTRHLGGLEDYGPMDWIIGRLMIFHKSLWEDVGGFDESRPHGGDTDFAIRCEKEGAGILRLPRRIVPHYDDESEFSTTSHMEWLFYLARRHPTYMAPKLVSFGLQMLGVINSRSDYKGGAQYRGDAYSTAPPIKDESVAGDKDDA